MGAIVEIVGKLLKAILKVLWWLGVYWLFICMSPVWIYELVATAYAKSHGSFFGIRPNSLGNIIAPEWLYNITFYLALVFIALTIIQNIYRFIKKQPKFNIFVAVFRLIMKRKKEVGFVAELNLDSEKDISGVVFGKYKGEYVTRKEQEDGHVLVIGGAGCGKSSGVAIPTLMSWKERVFAIDIKGELYSLTKKSRDENFIKVFNPTDRNANGYDPFFLLRNTDDLSSTAKELALSICPLPVDTKDPFWIKSAQAMLTGFIIYFFGFGLNFSESMLQTKIKPVKELIAEIMESDNTKAKIEISQFSGMDDKTVSGVFGELSNHITPFATNENLMQALDGHGECIKPDDLENGYDVFICIPEHKLEQWKELMTLIVNQFCKFFEKRKEGNKKPILFLLDECPRLGRIDSIATGLTTLRSKKITMTLIVQSKNQLDGVYGENKAIEIADNCSYKGILRASEPSTQKWCSDLVGTYEKQKTSNNFNADMVGIGKGTGTSTTTEEKRIIKPEEFAYLTDIVLLTPTGYHRIEKVSCYKESFFKNRLGVTESV